MTEKELRLLNADFEVREQDGEHDEIVGYALKFNRWSDVLGGMFKEIISRDALQETDMSDVVALFNHDDNKILGRKGKNLTLEVDEIGLKFRLKPTNTSYTKDLVENLRTGIIDKCSFAMSDIDSEWNDAGDDQPLERTITSIGKLWDVSIVTTPAYSDTEAVVGARSKEQATEFVAQQQTKQRLRKLLDDTAFVEKENENE